MGTSAEWDRIYDVRRDAYGNTICGCSIDRIGYRNSEIGREKSVDTMIVPNKKLYEAMSKRSQNII